MNFFIYLPVAGVSVSVFLLLEDARRALDDISRAAKSLRVLTDYLERHPEALIRGKPEEKTP